MAKLIDLKGHKYNMLVCGDRHPDNTDMVHVTCDCGNTKYVEVHRVRSGHTKSCGCLAGKNRATHGLTDTPTYRSWATMIQRCTNPNSPDYPRYGGRGVTVDETWLHFDAFLKDMGIRKDGTTLDRIDNEKGYGPGNCRWSSGYIQQRNKRPNRQVDWFGKMVPLVVAHEESGTANRYELVRQRLTRGWPLHLAIWSGQQ